jgi:hypothetical protein
VLPYLFKLFWNSISQSAHGLLQNRTLIFNFFQPLLQLRLYRIQRLFSGVYRILFLSLVSRCRSSVHRTFMRRRRLARIRVKYLFTQVQAAPTSQERWSGGLHVAVFSLFPAIFRLLVFDSVKLTRF